MTWTPREVEAMGKDAYVRSDGRVVVVGEPWRSRWKSRGSPTPGAKYSAVIRLGNTTVLLDFIR